MSTANKPLVGLVMGSDSDWPVMDAAAAALAEFGIPYEADVVSAHRMPAEMIAYGQEAHRRGLRVIIAGAGGAAHLPGMLASVTPLPVIGVPVPLKYLDGMDSLLSIVQMPAGVPVATVSIGGARNAGLLAVRMLAAGTDPLAAKPAAEADRFCRRTAPERHGQGCQPAHLGLGKRLGAAHEPEQRRDRPGAVYTDPVRYPQSASPRLRNKRAFLLLFLTLVLPGSAQVVAGRPAAGPDGPADHVPGLGCRHRGGGAGADQPDPAGEYLHQPLGLLPDHGAARPAGRRLGAAVPQHFPHHPAAAAAAEHAARRCRLQWFS